jgi:glycine/serine hydroxymethyltransferase
METVGHLIAETLRNPEDESQRQKSKKTVAELCKKFPLYESKILTAR